RADVRRILQILASGSEKRGNLAFTRDCRAEPVIRWSKAANHNDVYAITGRAGVIVGILFPGTNGLEGQETAANSAEEHLMIGGIGGRESGRVEGNNPLLELLQRSYLLV